MSDLLNMMLMGTPPGGGQGGGSYQSIIMLVLIVVVFYFFMIRPQVRRQKELKNFRESLKKGDRIITTGGIYGKINNISDNVITIDVGNNVTMKVDKNAVLKDNTDLPDQK